MQENPDKGNIVYPTNRRSSKEQGEREREREVFVLKQERDLMRQCVCVISLSGGVGSKSNCLTETLFLTWIYILYTVKGYGHRSNRKPETSLFYPDMLSSSASMSSDVKNVKIPESSHYQEQRDVRFWMVYPLQRERVIKKWKIYVALLFCDSKLRLTSIHMSSYIHLRTYRIFSFCWDKQSCPLTLCLYKYIGRGQKVQLAALRLKLKHAP